MFYLHLDISAMHLPIFDVFSGVYCENTCNKHCLFPLEPSLTLLWDLLLLLLLLLLQKTLSCICILPPHSYYCYYWY